MFELGEDLFNGIEIGTVGRQEEEFCSGPAYGLSHRLPLVGPEIVHDDNVAWRERGNEHLLDIGCEASSVDGAVEHARRIDAVAAQRGDQGQRLPVTVRDPGLQPLATRRPAPDRRHVSLGPGFVDEYKPSRIEAALILLPLRPPSRDVRTALLAWQNGFF